jgi:hypothetical protein
MFLDNSVAREMPAPQPEKPAVDVKLALAR